MAKHSTRPGQYVLLAAAACGTMLTSPLAGQTPVLRDSAGVQIVENSARARAPIVFRLGTTPVLDIGGAEEDDTEKEFSPNQGYLRAARLSDNGMAVIDVVRVHFFDARGKRLIITGRNGSGPDEFRYLMSVCRTRGDTVVVSDSRNARLGILDKKGGIVRTVQQGEHGSPPFNACLDDGTLILQRHSTPAPGSSRTVRVTRIRTDGSVVNTVGDFRLPPFDMVTQNEATVLAAQQRVYIGDAITSEIRVFTPAGQLTKIIRTADPLVRISASEAEERMRSTIPRNTSGAEAAQRMERMRSLPRAETWPAYRSVHVDPRGRLWVQDYIITRPAPDGWTAFDAEGRMLGRLLIPEPKSGDGRLQVISFGVDEVLVRRRDEDGFAHLTVFPIEPIRR
jgi:hypothetical protein